MGSYDEALSGSPASRKGDTGAATRLKERVAAMRVASSLGQHAHSTHARAHTQPSETTHFLPATLSKRHRRYETSCRAARRRGRQEGRTIYFSLSHSSLVFVCEFLCCFSFAVCVCACLCGRSPCASTRAVEPAGGEESSDFLCGRGCLCISCLIVFPISLVTRSPPISTVYVYCSCSRNRLYETVSVSSISISILQRRQRNIVYERRHLAESSVDGARDRARSKGTRLEWSVGACGGGGGAAAVL